MILRSRSKTVTLLLSLGLLISTAGCASNRAVVIHPIEKTDIFSVTAGEPFTSEKNGYFLSDDYVKEVMDAKVQ